MPMFFRLNNDGTVNVMLTAFSKTVTEKDFCEKSVKVNFDDFVIKYADKDVREQLRFEMSKLKRKDILSKVEPDKYYINGQEIAADEYNQINEILTKLGRIRDFNKPLDEDELVVVNKAKR